MAWINLDNQEALLKRISEGDGNAFAILFQQSNRPLFNAIMVYVKDPETAQDILQQIYLKIWENREKLTSIRDLDKYIYIIARNACFDHLKKISTRERIISDAAKGKTGGWNHVTEILDARETRETYENILKRLPPQQRRALELSLENNLSNAEIAEAMNISVYTVKRHLELARRFLRSNMDSHLQSLIIGLLLLRLS